MEASPTNKPQIDLGKFIIETFTKTLFASRYRRVIFFIILFLQFGAARLVTLLSGYYPATYDGLTRKMAHESGVEAFFVLIKYPLLLTLLIMSPPERTGRRRFAKYIVLLGALYLWALLDVSSSAFNHDSEEAELAEQSFKENSVPLYGKVVFSSYKRDEFFGKSNVAVAERVSAKTNGYIVIVQLNDSLYTYPGLKTLYHYFNDYTHHTYDSTFRTNIEKKVPDLSNCQEFIFNFSHPLERLPDLPAVDKYIKIRYDPIKNGIEMVTDSVTAATPVFDSIAN